MGAFQDLETTSNPPPNAAVGFLRRLVQDDLSFDIVIKNANIGMPNKTKSKRTCARECHAKSLRMDGMDT